MHLRRNRSGNPRIKNVTRVKAVNQGLRTSCRIAFANPCTNKHDILSGESSLIKMIGALYDFFPLFTELNQVGNLFLHGTDDSKHCLSLFSTLRFFFLHYDFPSRTDWITARTFLLPSLSLDVSIALIYFSLSS